MIEKRRRFVATRALAFSEEKLFATQFLFSGLGSVKPTLAIQFRRRREIKHVLHLRHMAYMDSIEHRKTFFHRTNRIPIEIGGAKFELCEIFHRPQAALGAMYLLIEQSAEADRIQAKTPLLRPYIGTQVKLRGRMPVYVTVKASDPKAGLRAFPVVGRVEFFLRQGGKQHLEPVKLHWSDNVLEKPVKIIDGNYLAT